MKRGILPQNPDLIDLIFGEDLLFPRFPMWFRETSVVLPICNLEHKWPLFWLEVRPCFGGLTLKIEVIGVLGAYTSIYMVGGEGLLDEKMAFQEYRWWSFLGGPSWIATHKVSYPGFVGCFILIYYFLDLLLG